MSAVVDTLLGASVEGAVVVVVVWLIVTLAPGVPPRVRVWLWWLVTARLLWALVPLPAIEIPWGYDVSTPAAVDAMLMASAADPLPAAAGHPPPVAWSISWRRATIAVAGALYVVGLLWQLAGLGADLVRTRRLARRAQRVPAEIDQRAAALASCVPMQAPPVRISSEIRSPLVVGSLRPMLLLPRGVARWPPRDLDLALAHELAHVRRRDLAWAWVPALAQRIFFFHPLARLAVREYVLAREAACDAEAVARMQAAPEDYGRLLLTLGCVPGSPLCAAAGATTFITLKRRLVMLERATTPASRWWWTLVAVALATLIPLTIVATPLPAAPPAPVAPPLPHATVPAAPPAASGPPVAPAPHAQHHGPAAADGMPWVLFEAGDGSQSVRAANQADIDEARRHRQGTEAMVWFRRSGVAYVSRDAQLLDAVRESFAAVRTIGERLSAAGARQGREGAIQGRVGEKQGALGAEMGRRGARIAEVTGKLLVLEGERLQAGQRTLTNEQATRRAELRAELEGLEREMRALADEQRALARDMEGKAALMRDEGRQMEALGSEMRRAVDDAMRRVASLFDQAVSTGTAQPAR